MDTKIGENNEGKLQTKMHPKFTVWNPVGDDLQDMIFVGDIHGEFGYTIHLNRQAENTMFIYCGDIGMGFYKPGYYEQTFHELNTICVKNNNAIVFIRGNHDDPDYFSGADIKTFTPGTYPRIHTVRDWEILRVENYAILCGGGAVSVDRTCRAEGISWWSGERILPIDTEWLGQWIDENDYWVEHHFIVTHTTPQEFPPYGNKGVLMGWAERDPDIIKDCNEERKLLGGVLDTYLHHSKTEMSWYYGHFHESYNGYISKDTPGSPIMNYTGLGIDERKAFIVKGKME